MVQYLFKAARPGKRQPGPAKGSPARQKAARPGKRQPGPAKGSPARQKAARPGIEYQVQKTIERELTHES